VFRDKIHFLYVNLIRVVCIHVEEWFALVFGWIGVRKSQPCVYQRRMVVVENFVDSSAGIVNMNLT